MLVFRDGKIRKDDPAPVRPRASEVLKGLPTLEDWIGLCAGGAGTREKRTPVLAPSCMRRLSHFRIVLTVRGRWPASFRWVALRSPGGRTSWPRLPVDHAPKLDGTLNDPLWLNAKPITDFRQREPREGEPATEKTEVRILYTCGTPHAFKSMCYDSGTLTDHRNSNCGAMSVQDLDDHFEILIDSNHDRPGRLRL